VGRNPPLAEGTHLGLRAPPGQLGDRHTHTVAASAARGESALAPSASRRWADRIRRERVPGWTRQPSFELREGVDHGSSFERAVPTADGDRLEKTGFL
jgi:hypothetical protein